ncbi:PINc domain-containing protein [Caenorhabditis elegans]|uniref:PINc domain-containing protein n=1 Tax=Caenorhabditis elegans TaxID=6239 RepID=Q9GYS5_CAEEL|nr:PINc domain-containing protein [Caenorhabditis elegans]CCD67602.1 PINc domain-containing protein [Caenorhabditis elegans]|eukprot:NP_491797.1 Uncharacterized protein CELE_T08B2.4 [Caenorhabditis elegans]
MLIHYLQQVELTLVLTNDPFEADHYLAQRVDLSVYEYIQSCMEHSKKVFTDRRMRSESSPTTHLQPHRIMVLSRNRYESIGLRGKFFKNQKKCYSKNCNHKKISEAFLAKSVTNLAYQY